MNGKERDVLERLEEKIDGIQSRLFDPDKGLYARVNENTRWRKIGQRILNIMLAGILAGVLGLLFFVIRNGIH